MSFSSVNFERNFIPEPNSGCWLWLGYSSNGRYGHIKSKGKRIPAARFSFELYRGPIPPGFVLDHLCKTTFCVNPAHLEPVTQLENMRRSTPALKQVCIHGHPYVDGFEYYYRQDGGGIRYRRCLTCYRLQYPGTGK
jgi:hypothetical protein